MYKINTDNFCNNLKNYRKSRQITLYMLGEIINKSKATISKYEKGEIIPDFTVLEICNALDISISQLLPLENTEKKNKYQNPFFSNIIYMYYYTENRLIKSVLEILEDNECTKVRFYNGIKDMSIYHDSASYVYDGILECDKTIGYINLTNTDSKDMQLEKLQLSINLMWSKNFDTTNFFILGLTPNSVPIVKKGILSVSPIDNFENFEDDLKITQEELLRINNDNGWILNNKNYNHFFFDK